MASGAADPFFNVDAVVEVDEVGQIVHAGPFDGCSPARACSHRLEHRTVGPDLTMAVHAGLGGGKSGEGRLLHRGVAVAAVDADVANMMLMAEWHWLKPGDVNLRNVGRTVKRRDGSNQDTEKSDAAEDTDPGDGVRAGVEDLRHRPNNLDNRKPPRCSELIS